MWVFQERIESMEVDKRTNSYFGFLKIWLSPETDFMFNFFKTQTSPKGFFKEKN